MRDYTISVYAADSVAITDSNGKTSNDLEGDLRISMYKALKNVTAYPYEDGGWYSTRRGYYDNTTYFFQMGGPTKLYNMNITVNITSFDSTAVTSSNQALPLVNVYNAADGSTTHTHQCRILPKSGVNECNYIVDTNGGATYKWSLVSWNYA